MLHFSTKVKKVVPLTKRETTRASRTRNASSLLQASTTARTNRRNITTRPTMTTSERLGRQYRPSYTLPTMIGTAPCSHSQVELRQTAG
jgi:hypothetical protein